MSEEVYRCGECGACCRHHIIEASVVDVLREPRIADRCEHLNGHGRIALLESAWSLSVVNGCPFQASDNHCEIYATRPEECVGFGAGSEKCHVAREADDLPALLPTLVLECTTPERIAAEVLKAGIHDLLK